MNLPEENMHVHRGKIPKSLIKHSTCLQGGLLMLRAPPFCLKYAGAAEGGAVQVFDTGTHQFHRTASSKRLLKVTLFQTVYILV